MPIIVEALSVVVTDEVVQSKLKGGVKAFLKMVPNNTHCTDGVLHRVGFMVPADVQEFVQVLQGAGLCMMYKNRFLDVAVVDMLMGPTMACSWLGFGRQKFFQDMRQFRHCEEDFSIAWHMPVGSPYGIPVDSKGAYKIAVPADWSPDKAIYSNNFIPKVKLEERLISLGNIGGITRFWDSTSGDIVYIGRPQITI
jgi:hypothetical protein